MIPNTHSGKSTRLSESPFGLSAAAAPAKSKTSSRYATAASSVAVTDPLTENTDARRLFRLNEETSATTAARMIVGPKLNVGANVYSITAKKMSASATDFVV